MEVSNLRLHERLGENLLHSESVIYGDCYRRSSITFSHWVDVAMKDIRFTFSSASGISQFDVPGRRESIHRMSISKENVSHYIGDRFIFLVVLLYLVFAD